MLNVWVSPDDDPAKAKPVTLDKHRGVVSYTWAFTSKHILYTQDKNGDEDDHDAHGSDGVDAISDPGLERHVVVIRRREHQPAGECEHEADPGDRKPAEQIARQPRVARVPGDRGGDSREEERAGEDRKAVWRPEGD